ncbi:hypothetical protein M9H77_06918 [Catharanthus roseus]|uniref:Uncharacterized protein n=1 Tax=Catharanthus roseus TaxID=4058 RepID=A0ACC0BTG8_CATRO|nr:hypothetical protein M9H77_06918 [Catharanthus roseus]
MEEGSFLVDMGQLMARIIAMQSQLNRRLDDIDGKIQNRLDDLDDKIVDIQNRHSFHRTKEAYLKSQDYILRSKRSSQLKHNEEGEIKPFQDQGIEDLKDLCLS